MTEKFEVVYWPESIADTLLMLAENDEADLSREDLIDCLYDLKAICENSCNLDRFRTMWRALENIAYNNELALRRHYDNH